MRTSFIGHSRLYRGNIEERLLAAIRSEIEAGCTSFIMGTHGEFDRLALSACRTLRREYKNIEIEVVLTSLHKITYKDGWGDFAYSDVKTVMYDIEDAHFKQQITLSNRLMIGDSDRLICYVDETVYRSGAKTAFRYAKKRGIKINNLFREEDRPYHVLKK